MRTNNIKITAKPVSGQEDILTSSAVRFLAGLHKTFNHRRKVLLRYRGIQQVRYNNGELPSFSDKQGSIRHFPWTVSSIPEDLKDRQVELTGPADHLTIVRGLNAGASVFVVDFEDATSPTWKNCIRGQINLRNEIRNDVLHPDKYGAPAGEKKSMNHPTAVKVRPRGLHLDEKHFLVDGEPISASLFDFGLYFFHNAYNLIQAGSGPYFSLPKLENRKEAELWNDIFSYAQNKKPNIPPETIKATACIETLPAVFEMDEIIYSLREHLVGLQTGRWNYIYSLIKNFRKYERYILPDRNLLDMSAPFMEAYSRLLVKMAHRRGAHAIGAMTAALPEMSKGYKRAMNIAHNECAKEANRGFDGVQVVHSDFVPVAREEFRNAIGSNNLHQKDQLKAGIAISRIDLLFTHLLDIGKITEGTLRQNIEILLLYISSWLRGQGVLQSEQRLENLSTVEICRVQIWQWIHQSDLVLDDGRKITKKLCQELLDQERERITRMYGDSQNKPQNFDQASELLANLVMKDDFDSHMTNFTYKILE